MTRVETIRPKRVDCHDSEARTSFMCTHELPCATRHVHGHMSLGNLSVIVLSCSMEAHKESDCCTVHRRKHQWRHPCLYCKNLGESFTKAPTEVTYTGSGPLKSFTLSQEATLLVPPLQIPLPKFGPEVAFHSRTGLNCRLIMYTKMPMTNVLLGGAHGISPHKSQRLPQKEHSILANSMSTKSLYLLIWDFFGILRQLQI